MPTDKVTQKKSLNHREFLNKSFLKLIIAITLPFILVLLTKTFLFDSFYIPTSSMENTLNIGDRVIVSYLQKDSPNQGDIIVFEDKQQWLTNEDQQISNLLVKRVLAVAGDTIFSDGQQVFVNEEAINEPYIIGETSIFEKQTVPAGTVFVLGDNRENSADSRAHITENKQFIDITTIIGKAELKYWPLDQLNLIK